ncbi:alkaline phosphatase family protein [Cellulosimicrobium protaetiae]|uniref:Alkaline phosphatase family protein n=1 Tax=Cellulosimicrobium protaetiae TaxID=2587808 RepID=A0A6M5UH85_9MICO|nr:nucleotide pyrophosphatase/phosphodiesterase family protein [Cellulosimicrobium protaetiae]QJW36942.1 alkaline phosphatase family protein [Cellulosimicrobium protaetiae]
MSEARTDAAPVTPALPAGLLAPDLGLGGLAAVLPGAAGALGVRFTTATGVGSEAARAALDLPHAERVCVVLVDGLGHVNLAERAGHAPFLRSLLPDARALTSTFPSTTAAAIGAFGTGTAPGRTGMLGYTQRNPATGGLANMVSWEGAPPPAELQRETPVLERVAAAGAAVTSTGPARFAGSGMTVAALRGASYAAAEGLGARVDAAVRALSRPGLVYLYWGEVDKAGHHHGSTSWQWGDELEALDRELARLARSVPKGTLVLVTADHGMVDVDPALRRDVATDPALARGVVLVGGEPRAVHVYTEPGETAAVAARWRDVLGDDALVLERTEVLDRGLLGPDPRPEAVAAAGDVIVALRGRATVVDSRTQTPASLALVGVHGSLTEREMRVPLLVAAT